MANTLDLNNRSERIHSTPLLSRPSHQGWSIPAGHVRDRLRSEMDVRAGRDGFGRSDAPFSAKGKMGSELDRPPRTPKGLKLLFSKPSVAESR